MVTRSEKNDKQSTPGKEKEIATPQAGAGKDDACRCKETANMTPRQLLELMMNDLAFWKKAKKE